MHNKNDLEFLHDMFYSVAFKNHVDFLVHRIIPSCTIVYDTSLEAPAGMRCNLQGTTLCINPELMFISFLEVHESVRKNFNSVIRPGRVTCCLQKLNEKSHQTFWYDEFKFIADGELNCISSFYMTLASLFVNFVNFVLFHEIFHKKYTVSNETFGKLIEEAIKLGIKIIPVLAHFIFNIVEDDTIQRLGRSEYQSNKIISSAFDNIMPYFQGHVMATEYLNTCPFRSIKDKLFIFIHLFYAQSNVNVRLMLTNKANELGMSKELIESFYDCVSTNDKKERARKVIFEFYPLVYDYFLTDSVNNAMQAKTSTNNVLDASNITEPDESDGSGDSDSDSDSQSNSESSDDSSSSKDSNDKSDSDSNNQSSSDSTKESNDDGNESDNETDSSSSNEGSNESETDGEDGDSSSQDGDETNDEGFAEESNDNESSEVEDSKYSKEDSSNGSAQSDGEDESSDNSSDNSSDDSSKQDSSSPGSDCSHDQCNSDPSSSQPDSKDCELTDEELKQVEEQLANELEKAAKDISSELHQELEQDSTTDYEDESNIDVENLEDSSLYFDISDYSSMPVESIGGLYSFKLELPTILYNQASTTFQDLVNRGDIVYYDLEDGDLNTDAMFDSEIEGRADIFMERCHQENEFNLIASFFIDCSGSMFNSRNGDVLDSSFGYSCLSVSAIRKALCELNVQSSVILFANRSAIVCDYNSGDEDLFTQSKRLVNCNGYNLGGGTNLLPPLKHLYNDTTFSSFGGDRLVIILTDGATCNSSACREYIEKFIADDVKVLGIYISAYGDDVDSWLESLFKDCGLLVVPFYKLESDLCRLIYEYISNNFIH